MVQQSNPPDRTKSSTTEQNGGITRRSYLQSIIGGAGARLGTTVGGAIKVGMAAMGTVAASDHEVIRARGQTIRIGQGESFENTLIDLTTDDSIALLVDGGNSVIRNVGFRGLYRGVDVPLSISAPRGTVLVERLYLGDGATGGGSDPGPGAVVYHSEASSDVTFRRCNVQGWPNGGFDCSNTASGGSATFETCYGKNNGVATFRCAGSSDSIRNCVGYNDDTDYGSVDGDHATRAGHPVWVWPPGAVTIEASHFASTVDLDPRLTHEGSRPGFGSGASGRIRGETRAGDVDTESDLSVPEGVPTSAEKATTN